MPFVEHLAHRLVPQRALAQLLERLVRVRVGVVVVVGVGVGSRVRVRVGVGVRLG